MTRGLWGVGTHLPAPVYSFDWSTSGTALTNNPFSIASLDDRMAWLTLRTPSRMSARGQKLTSA
jgi:hypothetical protein